MVEDCCKNKKEELREYKGKIQYLYVNGCHAWLDGILELHNALIESNYLPDFEVICIRDDSMAKEIKFCGSPSILINGLDVDDMAKYVKKYSKNSCRPYIFEGKNYEFVPKEMIKIKLTN